MFKGSSLMGKFPLPPLNVTFYPINMISLVTIGSLGSSDPWVVPRPSKIKSYRVDMSLFPIEVSYSMI
jgi:hypothetical protein